MATLIAVYNSDGCVGRCDAKCYDATLPDCECICGGRNHGAGKKQAIENTQKLAAVWIKDFARKHHLSEFDAVVPALAPVQITLPGFDGS
jgi:hypothetical protein